MGGQPNIPGFTSREVVHLVGGSQRLDYYRLNYWIKTGLVRAGVQAATGKGSVRRFALGDVVAVGAVLALREAGVSLQSVRKAADYLQKHHRLALERARLIIVPGRRPDLARIVVTDEDERAVVESLVHAPGQYVAAPVFSLDLEPLRRGVRARVVELEEERRKRQEVSRELRRKRTRKAVRRYRAKQRERRRAVAT